MPWQPTRTDRAKSIALVAALHLALGAALFLGFGSDRVREVTDSLRTFDVPAPAEPPVARDEQQDAAPKEAGAVDLEARSTPLVAPPPAVVVPPSSPLPAAQEPAPDTGMALTSGAGDQAGPGRGAGGDGAGDGGGGSGGGAGSGGLASSARLLSGNLNRSDYRRVRSFGAPRGRAVLAIEVSADGRLARCQPIEGSGVPALDDELCRLLQRTRWVPAMTRDGRPVAIGLRYVATWNRD